MQSNIYRVINPGLADTDPGLMTPSLATVNFLLHKLTCSSFS